MDGTARYESSGKVGRQMQAPTEQTTTKQTDDWFTRFKERSVKLNDVDTPADDRKRITSEASLVDLGLDAKGIMGGYLYLGPVTGQLDIYKSMIDPLKEMQSEVHFELARECKQRFDQIPNIDDRVEIEKGWYCPENSNSYLRALYLYHLAYATVLGHGQAQIDLNQAREQGDIRFPEPLVSQNLYPWTQVMGQ